MKSSYILIENKNYDKTVYGIQKSILESINKKLLNIPIFLRILKDFLQCLDPWRALGGRTRAQRATSYYKLLPVITSF